MTNMIRYECDGRSAIYGIPFAYAAKSDVRVNAQLADGTEIALAQDRDYIIDGAALHCVRPKGDRLIIWLDAPAPTPAQLMTARSAAMSADAAFAAQAQEAAADESAKIAQAIDSKLAIALAQIDEWTRLGVERMYAELARGQKDCLAAINDALSDGMRSLKVATVDLEEKGSAIAKQAESYSGAAKRSAAVALSAQTGIQQAKDAQGSAAITAQGWASASQKSAEESWRASASAWDAARQVSIHAERPGICAVADVSAIHACSPGLFIINEHLTHTPTPFFGVWPARKIEDMAWDAVFFLSPYLYPDDPRMPPPLPERPKPDPVVASGSKDQWLPCGHQHEDTIIYSSCPVCGCKPE